ncbi:MAG: AraC family transcriptional regulator [Anaerostipes sp.]|nr:AraC family transcriptional regulator [Anaerostipes sp.]
MNSVGTMNYIFNKKRYALIDCHMKIESLFQNDIHKSTGVYVFPLHRHEELLEISLILKGEEIVEFEDATYMARAGDVVIKNANVLHQETAEDNSELEELSIGISGIRIEGLSENSLVSEDIIPVIHTDYEMDLLQELFLSLQRMQQSGLAIYTEIIQSALKTLVSMVLLLVDKKGMIKTSKFNVGKQIRGIIEYINDNFCNKISLNDIAKDFYISPYYLARQFKSETGYSVNQYIQLRRLGRAEQRLAFEETSIKEIAFECGYTNLKYFYSVFKSKTGHTPNEFRCLIQSTLENEDKV